MDDDNIQPPILVKETATVTVEEMAKILRIGRNKAYALVAKKKIKCLRLGKNIRISRTYIMDLLESEVVF